MSTMTLQSNPLYEKVKERIEGLFDLTRRALADSDLTLKEGKQIICRFLQEANATVADVDASEGDREKLFSDVCMAAWEDLGKPIQLTDKIWGLKSLPDWIRERVEEKIIDPLLGSIVELSADVLYWALSEEPAAAE